MHEPSLVIIHDFGIKKCSKLMLYFACPRGCKDFKTSPAASLSGIFLENIFKYQNDHGDTFGGAILTQ